MVAIRRSSVDLTPPLPPRTTLAAKPVDRATLAKKGGMLYLFHRTPASRLPSIVKSGLLKAGKNVDGEQGDPSKIFATKDFSVVFLSAANASFANRGNGLIEWLSFGGSNQAMLVFSLEPLNRSDYHLTDAYAKGEKTRASVGPNDVGKFARGMQSMANEAVFSHPVSLKALREIWVRPGTRVRTLNDLRKHGIEKINGRPIEEVVVARDRFAPDATLAGGRLTDDLDPDRRTSDQIFAILQAAPEVVSVKRKPDRFVVELKYATSGLRDLLVRRIAPYGTLPPGMKESVVFKGLDEPVRAGS